MGGRAQPENGADSQNYGERPTCPECGNWQGHAGDCISQPDYEIQYRPRRERDEAAEAAQTTLGAGKPKPTRAQITLLVLEQLGPGAPPAVLEHEVAMVEMADRLGRAIHEAKKVGGPWGPPCMTPKPGLQWSSDPSDHHSYCQFYRERAGCTCQEGRRPGKDDFVPVPYGFDGTGEFECDCEAMALHLVEEMAKASKLEALT